MLENDSAKLKELREDAIAFGVAINDVDAEQLKQAGDAIHRIEGVAKGAATTIGVELAPYIAQAANDLADLAKESGGFKKEIKEAVQTSVQYTGKIVEVTGELYKGFKSLPEWAQEVGVVGAILTGKKGVVVLAGLSKFAQASKTTADWWSAYANDHIGFVEWFTTGNEEAKQKLEELKQQGIIVAEETAAAMDNSFIQFGKRLQDYTPDTGENTEVQVKPALVEQAALTEEFIEEHNARVYEIQEAAEIKRAALIKAHRQAELNLTGDIFQNLSSLMASEHKKEFELGKKAAIAGALVKGYQAVVNSYEKGTEIGGPYVGAVFAATAAVATKMQIDAIRRQQFQGGGGSIPNISGGTGNQPNDPGSTPPINPQAGFGNQRQQSPQIVVNVTVVGNAVGIDDLDQVIADSVKRGIDNDNVLIPSDSMNGIILQDS